jgi:hypothetical protein
MANLFQKRKLLFAVLAGIFVLLIIIILAINIQNRPSQKYSAPDLIQLAFVRGEITEEERLLYLAYALGDFEKLPTRFDSNYPWSGTFIAMDLHEAVTSKSVMCKLSPYTQSELRRILREGVACD